MILLLDGSLLNVPRVLNKNRQFDIIKAFVYTVYNSDTKLNLIFCAAYNDKPYIWETSALFLNLYLGGRGQNQCRRPLSVYTRIQIKVDLIRIRIRSSSKSGS